ncbi:A/G-specific adenine glycosylase [soil metagenome]
MIISSFPKFRRALLAWSAAHGRDLPWRRTRDPYAILVSELMLQQTQVATVLSYYREWLRRFPDVRTLAAASASDVLHAWQGLGYYARARNLHAAAKIIVEQHRGTFPTSAEEIRKLPGVGRYTANAVATFAFDHSLPIVEANTARLLARLLNLQLRIDSTAGQQHLWSLATGLLPRHNAGTHNSALMDLGALICTPGQPNCPACPVREFCTAVHPAKLPLKKPRTELKQLTEHHSYIRRNGSILLEQSTDRWRGMWIFPRLANPPAAAPLHQSHFPFTHHRVALRIFKTKAPRGMAANQKWTKVEEVEQIAMPSPHRRALRELLAASAAGSCRNTSSYVNFNTR